MAAKTVLVVEDDMINRRLIKKILQPLQCTVIEPPKNADDRHRAGGSTVPGPYSHGHCDALMVTAGPRRRYSRKSGMRDIPLYVLSGYSPTNFSRK